MEIEKANKIIAEYMNINPNDGRTCPVCEFKELTQWCSLDSLVPVWKKLSPGHNDIQMGLRSVEIMIGTQYRIYMHGDSIQKAACITTAERIEALKEND